MTNSTAIMSRKYGNKGGAIVENFKQIDKCDVWAHLQAGKKVYAVIFKSRNWNEGMKELWHNWNVGQINRLLSDKEKNVIYYEEIEV